MCHSETHQKVVGWFEISLFSFGPHCVFMCMMLFMNSAVIIFENVQNFMTKNDVKCMYGCSILPQSVFVSDPIPTQHQGNFNYCINSCCTSSRNSGTALKNSKQSVLHAEGWCRNPQQATKNPDTNCLTICIFFPFQIQLW